MIKCDNLEGRSLSSGAIWALGRPVADYASQHSRRRLGSRQPAIAPHQADSSEATCPTWDDSTSAGTCPMSGRDATRASRAREFEEARSRGKRKLDDAQRKALVSYLKEHHVVTLATAVGGQPWAAALFYASQDLTIYFLSDPESRHCANIQQNPVVSAAIHQNYLDWREIRGLQLEGVVEEVPTREVPVAMEVYLSRFPFVRELATPEGLFRVAGRVMSAKVFRLLPSRLLLLDNRKGFGYREEFIVEEEEGRR